MQNLNTGAELYAQYNWYKNVFPTVIQQAADEFFLPGFQIGLIGISKNINPLMDKDSYFVTKVRIDKLHDMFFRSSQNAVAIILDRALGKAPKRFDLNRMTDLEAKIITAFNDFLYSVVVKFLAPAPPALKRTNFDMIHLTFFIKDLEENTVARFIVSLPDILLKPDIVVATGEHFEYDDFKECTIDVDVKVGQTKFSVFELKELDVGDIVVFEDSNIKQMQLGILDCEKVINIDPNMGLVMPIDNEGEEDMSDNKSNVNLWDSIEVEMTGHFDAVKITLGELKKIESGMVVDLTSIYDNKITLSVEDKAIARGELVIVNDRYGVKIDEVVAKAKPAAPAPVAQEGNSEMPQDMPTQEEGFQQEEGFSEEGGVPQEGGGEEEEFDYSDFELEDDI